MKKVSERRTIRRRDFLKGIGLGAGALTLGKISVVDAALLPAAAKKERFNVVVVGSGLAGRSAAIEARMAGAEVVLLEKMEDGKDGGNSKLAMGSIVTPKDRSKEAADAYFDDFMKKSMGRGNAELSRILAENVLDGVEWLKSHGVEFLAPIDAPPYQVKSVSFAPAQFMGMAPALAKLKDKYLKSGGKIVYQTKAKQLIMDNQGKVAGVRCATRHGLVDYMGDTVILATGGYAANKEMLETFVDPDADQMMVRGGQQATGDGLMMAREAGAMWVNMGGLTSLHVAAVSASNPSSGNPSGAVPYAIGINREGVRYVDESKGYVAHGKAALKQPGQRVALVFDSGINKEQRVTISVGTFKRLGIPVVEADSLEELASKINVPAAKLAQTVTEFNNAVKDGKALEANPPKATLAYKIEGPKYYAFYPLVPGVTLSFGGIRINGKAQVLEADGMPIGGLLAAGECAGGLYYDDYIGGGSLANCLVMGRIAGKEAAARKTALKKEKPTK
jgi:flavocytochrome c